MKITQDEVVDRQTVLHIELEEQDLSSYLDRGYRRVVQRAAIPGFRKGKAPRSVVESYVGREHLLQESIDFLVPDVTDRAIAAQEIEATGRPNVELVDLEPVKLKATVPLSPDVDLGAYQDLRIEETTAEVSDDDVQARLDQLLREAASWEPVERPVQLGDMLTMNVVGTVEGNALLEETDAVYVAEEENALPFPGFSQRLVGAEAGAPREFDVEIPDDHTDPNLAGKQADFTVTVSDIKERLLPELDDEFAKGVDDGHESLAALRKGIETDLNEQAEKAQEAQYKEAALDELLKGATVELPPLLVDHELEHMVSRRDQFVDSLKMRMDDYLRFTGKTEEQSQEEMREQALERLSRSYALTTLAESEGLEVSTEEIDEKIAEIVSSRDDQAERIRPQDLESEEVRGSISSTLLVEKSLDRLITITKGKALVVSGSGRGSSKDKKETEQGGETVDTKG